MKIIQCTQGEEDWYAAKLGKPSASNFFRIIKPTGGKSDQADKYMNELIAEIISGERSEKFVSKSMDRGKELEEEAVERYALLRNVEPVKVGLVTNDAGTICASPDRLVGDDGLIEIKCPDPDNHIEHALKQKLEQKHRPQTQGQLWIAERDWCDTICHSNKIPQVIMRSERDNAYIMEMASLVNQFLEDMQKKIEVLRQRGYMT